MARTGDRQGQRAPGQRATAPSRPTPEPAPEHDPVLGLQRAAGNRATNAVLGQGDPHTIRRVFDAFGHKVPTTNLGLRPSFTGRHVADDAAGAEKVTDDRYQRNDMPAPMLRGRMSNSVAKRDSWLKAVDASTSQVETENQAWTKGVSVKVDGWSVRWNVRQGHYETTEAKGLELQAGGVAEAPTRASRKGGTEVGDGRFLLDHVESEKK